MIVCVCNALRERDCREAAAHPQTRNAGCVYRRLGCRVRCGACVATMQEIVQHMREAVPAPPKEPEPAGS